MVCSMEVRLQALTMTESIPLWGRWGIIGPAGPAPMIPDLRAAAEAIARQPNASDRITGAVNLPLFLLEGVAILAEVFVLLIVLLK
jgi:F0F1-type ATP synthase membrane subunit c/vacuolar-type H+-ATPase subunit K